MKLVVGLGNKGNNYNNTRHNIGFDIVDKYLEKYGAVNWKSKFNGLYSEFNICGEKVVFLKPQSYMNLSGEVVRKFVDFYKINISNILVISDDLDLKIGNYRLRSTGSAGGHNGLKNIELHLGTKDYKRLKIGISSSNLMDTKDYVLGKFSSEELCILKEINVDIFNLLDDYFENDFLVLINKYNRKNR